VEESAQHGYFLEPQNESFKVDCVAEALHDLGVDDRMVYDGGQNIKMHHTHNRDDRDAVEEYKVSIMSFQD
jgi:hypothetical protein